MSAWRRLVGNRPIVTRLVLAVAGAMTVVLVASGAFVFWRVEYALNRQLDQDLAAYQEVVERAVQEGTEPPADTPGETFQVYDADGRVIDGSADTRLVGPDTVRVAASGLDVRTDVGSLLPASDAAYRVVTTRVRAPGGDVVVAAAISRHKLDEALRELLLQLTIAGLATLAAASLVGYATARAALNPVERYRRAAEEAEGAAGRSLLPVDDDRDDEVTRLGRTFNDLLDRIGQANERERQSLADASHELRSPLALMRTEIEMALHRRGDDVATQEALESLRDQVDRLVALSDALLDLEELRAATDAPAPREPVDVESLVAGVAARFEGRAAQAGRRIDTEVTPGLVIEGHGRWLELALANLVSNALRHGGGRITITAIEAVDHVSLTVDDEGPGFPLRFVATAFDRFTRAEVSRTTRGSGLGLSLVQAVAQAHGGTAVISGAAVTLELPVRTSVSPPARS